MPWELLFAAIGSSSFTAIILTVLFITLAQKWIEQATESAGRKFEHTLIKAEEAYKQAIEWNSQVDTHLREQRIKVYTEVWEAMRVLPKYPRVQQRTYKDIHRFSEELRDWYFSPGGMFMSQRSRDAFIALQDAIWTILPKPLEDNLSEEEYDLLRQKASALRTELTSDILSRRAAPQTTK